MNNTEIDVVDTKQKALERAAEDLLEEASHLGLPEKVLSILTIAVNHVLITDQEMAEAFIGDKPILDKLRSIGFKLTDSAYEESEVMKDTETNMVDLEVRQDDVADPEIIEDLTERLPRRLKEQGITWKKRGAMSTLSFKFNTCK